MKRLSLALGVLAVLIFGSAIAFGQNPAGIPSPAATFIQYVRGAFTANLAEGSPAAFFANNRGDSLMAQSLPELTEIVRMGNSYQVQTSTATAFLTATPTTTAGLSVWNGEFSTGRSYVIDSVGFFKIIIDTTQVDSAGLFVMNNKTPVTAPTDAALTIRSLSARSYAGRGRTLVAGAVTNDGWFPACTSNTSLSPVVGGTAWETFDCPLHGMYIVPPGGMFNLVGAEVTATASKIQYFVRWHEVQLTLGF